MATLKRKRIVGGSNKIQATLAKRKRELVAPKSREHMSAAEEMDAMIREEEGEDSELTLKDLAASDDEVEEDGENQYYKDVGDDPIFEGDEEMQAYIESKKRGLLRPSINDKSRLQMKLREITDGAPWPETLQISAEDDLECDDIQDDLAREGAFYKQALWAAEAGLNLCEEFGLKHVRPNDYYAEMLKTDKHMYRVRQQIALDKKKVEIKEQRRAQRDKQRKKDKEEETRKQKRLTKALKDKYREKNANNSMFDMELDDEDEYEAKQKSNKPKGLAGLRGKGFKRQAKEAKFGTGKGKKTKSKYNTKESYLGLERLGPARKTLHNATRQGRPGKAKRAQSKSKARR